MTIGHLTLFVGSELVAGDRNNSILELVLSSPSNYSAILATRLAALMIVGTLVATTLCFGMLWLIGVGPLSIRNKMVFGLALACTVLGSIGLTLLVCPFVAIAPSARTYQNSITGPIYLLSGVLAPAHLLPQVLQELSPFIFLTWSAQLMRDSVVLDIIPDVAKRFSCLLGLSIVTGALGVYMLHRVLERLRLTGKINLV